MHIVCETDFARSTVLVRCLPSLIVNDHCRQPQISLAYVQLFSSIHTRSHDFV
jgi:hypothetical protein